MATMQAILTKHKQNREKMLLTFAYKQKPPSFFRALYQNKKRKVSTLKDFCALGVHLP